MNDENAILFDDEVNNRNEWNGIAYDVNNILEVLGNLVWFLSFLFDPYNCPLLVVGVRRPGDCTNYTKIPEVKDKSLFILTIAQAL